MWSENTGFLSHLETDPLPDQVHLVHHILASGNLNWLIADDVGLDRTIETGMLLAALKQRDSLNRVLLVTPAGLTKQWQGKLNYKFRMGELLIYGDDFRINNPDAFSEWLKQPAETGAVVSGREQNERWFKAAEQAADQRLAEVSNRHLHPENMQWVAGAWVE
jgi:hypothetical protein